MNDRAAYKIAGIAVGVLGLVVVCTLVGSIVLAIQDKTLAGEAIALGSTALAGIPGVLAWLSGGPRNSPQEVVGPQGGPVPVDDAG